MIRDDTMGAGAGKQLMSRNFYRLINFLSDTPITPGAADFQLLDRAALDALLSLGDQRPFLRGMISWLGFSTTALHYVAGARAAGVSSYTWRRMMSMAVDAITAFSVKPLRLSFYIGCLSALLSLIYLIYILAQLVTGHTVEGWTSLMVVLLFLGAAQLVTLGIIGEYIGASTTRPEAARAISSSATKPVPGANRARRDNRRRDRMAAERNRFCSP